MIVLERYGASQDDDLHLHSEGGKGLRRWSGDLRQRWALVPPSVYTVYLHVRLVLRRRDAVSSIFRVVAFLGTVVTFADVNDIPPELHGCG